MTMLGICIALFQLLIGLWIRQYQQHVNVKSVCYLVIIAATMLSLFVLSFAGVISFNAFYSFYPFAFAFAFPVIHLGLNASFYKVN